MSEPEYLASQESSDAIRAMLAIYAKHAEPFEAAVLREAAKRMERLETALADVIDEIDDYVGYMSPSLQPGGSAYDRAKEAINGRS